MRNTTLLPREASKVIDQFFNQSIWWQLLIIAFIAAVIRGIYWVITPAATAGDSHTFLTVAQAIIEGDITVVLNFPFHITYSLLLIPGFIFTNGLSWYIPLLHIVLSSMTVCALFLISKEISKDDNVHLITVVAGMFYPYLLHWMKYILTEVAFIPILLLFIYLTIKILKRSSKKAWSLWAYCALIFLFTRPVSLLVLIVSGIVVMTAEVRRKFPDRWRMISSALVFIGVLIGAAVISRPSVSQRIFSLHSVTESLWLSTRVVKGTFEEYTKAELPPETSGMTASELREYKKNVSIDFIRAQPAQYLLMGVQRFFNYFYPWVHPQWSFQHRVFDAVLSLVLTIAAIVSLKSPANKGPVLLLLACALALGVTTAFSQIDTDGRYRLPAEVLILPASCAGAVFVARKLQQFFQDG